MNLKVKNREIVVPGELLAEGDCLLGEGAYKKDGKSYANVLGLVDAKEKFLKVIPLSGRYIPKERDLVIGIVTDISFSRWSVDLNSAYTANMNISTATERYVERDEDLSKIYDVGDAILAKVLDVSKATVVGLTMKERGLHKLKDGRLLEINPARVPRVIGRKGTMVTMLKERTGCNIIVGQNGRVWLKGDYPTVATRAIRLIEREAHTSGLTEKVEDFLNKAMEKAMKKKSASKESQKTEVSEQKEKNNEATKKEETSKENNEKEEKESSDSKKKLTPKKVKEEE